MILLFHAFGILSFLMLKVYGAFMSNIISCTEWTNSVLISSTSFSRRNMAEILLILRKTTSNQSSNQLHLAPLFNKSCEMWSNPFKQETYNGLRPFLFFLSHISTLALLFTKHTIMLLCLSEKVMCNGLAPSCWSYYTDSQ